MKIEIDTSRLGAALWSGVKSAAGLAGKALAPLGSLASLAVLALVLSGGFHGCTPLPPIPWPPAPGPGPKPPDPPAPPAPIPAPGFRVLVVYDSATLTKLPAAQQAVLFDHSVRDYLDAHCVLGTDGKTHEWRMWPDGTDGSADGALWTDAMKRKRDSLPWLVVSNGKAGTEGPLPANVADMLALLKKYAEGN